VAITDLESLEERCPEINMVTTVIIGNSTTYLHQGRMVTPRGYEKRKDA
jgi:precorrin-3B C17-methyltransferase